MRKKAEPMRVVMAKDGVVKQERAWCSSSPALKQSVNSAMGRFAVNAARDAGMTPARLARIPCLNDEVLGDVYARVPTGSVLRSWEQVTLTDRGSGVGAFAAERSPLGTFGVWDQLFAASANLVDAFRVAADYTVTIGDAAVDRFDVVENGALVTVGYRTGTAEQDIVNAVEQFGMGLFVTRARAASGKDVKPVKVTFRHRAPAVFEPLAEVFGTRNIEFEAERNTITFFREDATAPLPGYRPGLIEVLRAHADSTLLQARSVVSWLDAFREMLGSSIGTPDLSLAVMADRMATTPRTLQRRLAESGTTWRAEVGLARARQASALLRSSSLPVHAVASRTGYSDPRALRRAVQRWQGVTPAQLRGESR
ncbi:AraC family transcriptional regulator [Streptomyces sp. VRA16 Mangrove soil]|uniref:AraC family transcriptional regulator n=1 Tax=Streptomyces sp. VRA16 Mangrove soil TaxID=2817434 RepID=UPI001A9DCD2F|nr:AraC family transcriptional regulator [Streptomyces sp. VRA16 Mangrove soil]MBO1331351.1 AraC family transcriptional regulator ligand-binding domain-containing protein [Streptomyces sp. VRA16 Mangrove soil]